MNNEGADTMNRHARNPELGTEAAACIKSAYQMIIHMYAGASQIKTETCIDELEAEC